jgi:F-type H+-transporting ATPase subunit a
MNLTVTMALMSILLVIFASIRIKGLKGWLRYHIEPIPIILPFKLLDYFIRPLSLSMRLFGNILGAFIVMELLYVAMPMVLPAAFSIYFDLFDGMLQAYVFVFLTSLYIAEAIE